MKPAFTRPPDERVNWLASMPFIGAHLVPLLAIFTGVTLRALVLAVVLYVGRMFFITAGYHRYFAHRSFKTSRAFQTVMAVGGASALQKGPLWWAGHHRDHHRFSDTDRDLHSPQKGFWWSHLGWILSNKNKGIDYDRQIKDFAAYRELRVIDRYYVVPGVILAVICWLVAGWPGVTIGFFASTVFLWHGTFTVNSLAHVMGRRRYATTDTSRNSALIAAWTLGEGWHNNHHYYPASVRQGFFWWEYDVTYYALRGLGLVHVVTDLKTPPARIKAAARVDDGQFDLGMFTAHWQRARAALSHTTAALASARAALQERLSPGDEEPIVDPTASGAGASTTVAASPPLAPEQVALATATDGTTVDAPTRKQQIDEQVRTHRAALEESIQSALRHAEALSKLTRTRQRELGLASGRQ